MLSPFTVTGPFTGSTFTIVPFTGFRGAWDAEGNYTQVEETRFEILDVAGNFVQFANHESELEDSVARADGWHDGIEGSPFD